MRRIAFFDDDFKKSHPEIPVEKRTDSPDVDKEIGDSRTLLPVLRDYVTFLGDSAFDSYDTYRSRLGEFGFARAVIPMNCRNAANGHKPLLDEFGIPLCPAP